MSSTISDNTGTNGGAGIWAAGDVTITRSEISGNTATDSSGGAVQTEGSISAVDSLFVDNHATGGGSGGAFDADDGVSVSTSSFFSNSAGDGGGAIRSFGPVSITSSYFRENSTEGDSGGGGAVDGGQGGPIDVVNSTFTENSAGAAFGGGIIGGDIHLVYSDVVRNGAAAGANLAWEGQLTSFGSVVALPGDGGQNCFFAGGSTSAGYNFSDDASCNFTATGDRQNAGDPMLPIFGSPDAQGSICIDSICASTFGLIPLSGSPLVDAIPVAACRDDGAAAVTTDVFGTSRPQGNGCDIGAVEALVTAPPPGPPMQPPIITPRFTG